MTSMRYSYVEFIRHLPLDGPAKPLVSSLANVDGDEDERGIALPGGVLVPWGMVACRIGQQVDPPAAAAAVPPAAPIRKPGKR